MQTSGLSQPQSQQTHSNQFRISEQLAKLANSNTQYHKPIITKISKNRAEIKLKYEIQQKGFVEEKLVFQQNLQYEDEDAIFFMIVLHQMYPWCPPLLFCLSQGMFPRLDDSRDFLEDVIEGEWWPNITVSEIIGLIPKFIGKLFNKYAICSPGIRTSFQYGKRTISDSLPHSIDCMIRNCKGLTLCHAQYFNRDDVLIGKYQKIIVGLSWSDIVVFKKKQAHGNKLNNDDDKYYLMRKWGIRSIKKIISKKKGTIKEKKTNKILDLQGKSIKQITQQTIEKYQFCILLKDQKKQYIKIKFQSAQKIETKKRTKIITKSSLIKSLNMSLQFEEQIQKCQKQNQIQQKIEQQQMKMESKKIKKLQENQQKNVDPENSEVNIKLPQQKQNNSQVIMFEQPKLEAAYSHTIVHLPQLNPQQNLIIFRHIMQYIQLRQCVLANQQSFQSKIRMLSQIIQNSCELEEQVQLQMYYQNKLKEAITNEYVNNAKNQVESLTSKFQFDI